jgi:asparagine synthase (glutamine-hydrolysing)
MCGILGYYLFNDKGIVDKEKFLIALRKMEHRGPDDEGYWESEDKKVCFGHRRLSIIDLSVRAHQPMVSENKKYIITYNGEIYNFKEIEIELRVKNSELRVKSNSDTEIILKAFEEWGEGCLDKLRGMFAFAIYDKSKDTMFFARDRMGVKPFYYTVTANGFYFSSEIKPLLDIAGIKKELRKESVIEYLAFGKVHQPNTMFANVYKLFSSTCGIVDEGGFKGLKKYWTPYKYRFEFGNYKNDNDYAVGLFELLKESVNYRLISDVPVGIFLSGGVDSTGILSMIKYLGKENDIFTYSAGFEGESIYDERAYAKKAAGFYGTRHFEINITKNDLIHELPQILKYVDEPISDATIIPIFFLSKLARDNGSIVILNGDGADELFGGYSKWLEYRKYFKYWRLLNILPGNLIKQIPRIFGTNNLKGQIINDLCYRAYIKTQFYIGDTGALKGTSAFNEIVDDSFYDVFNKNFEEYTEIRKSRDYIEWMSYWGLKSIVENVFLYRADRMGMANSIEIRVPYLDQNVVEFGMQMPQFYKYKNKTGKYILKKALDKIVSGEFLYRNKMGFCVPVKKWAGREIENKCIIDFSGMNKESKIISGSGMSELFRLIEQENTDTKESLLFNIYSLTSWHNNWFK